jgi:outer membrane protein OmpA-like peptidoglycan-associated protein
MTPRRRDGLARRDGPAGPVTLAAVTLAGAVVFAGLPAGTGAAATPAPTPTVVPASPVPRVGRLAPPTIRPLVFLVESLDGSEGTRRTGDETTIVLTTDVLFAFGSAQLSPQAMARLDAVAKRIAGARGTVEVVGHTDNVGRDSVNIPLSKQRAEAVAAVLRPRLPGVNLTVDGRGSAEPVAANRIEGRDNPEGRARNRRVEITYRG